MVGSELSETEDALKIIFSFWFPHSIDFTDENVGTKLRQMTFVSNKKTTVNFFSGIAIEY